MAPSYRSLRPENSPKVMYLALRNLARKWNAVQGWKEALNRITITQFQPKAFTQKI
ncbi:MAG: hypothetical protein ACYDBH_21610 [Acidobacteriaceae bacterium]